MGTIVSHIYDKIQEYGSLENYYAAELGDSIKNSEHEEIPYFPNPEEVPRSAEFVPEFAIKIPRQDEIYIFSNSII